jgi:hypothetical protein
MNYSEKHTFIIQSFPTPGRLGLELKAMSRIDEVPTFQLSSLPLRIVAGPEAEPSTNEAISSFINVRVI